MSLKNRLQQIEQTIEDNKPEQFIMVWDCEDGIEIKSCCDITTGKRDPRIYKKIEPCTTVDELKEATKGERVNLLIIKARHERVSV